MASTSNDYDLMVQTVRPKTTTPRFSLVTEVDQNLKTTDMAEMEAAADWSESMETLRFVLELGVPIGAGILGLILILLILGVKALRQSRICWHFLSLTLAVLIKADILIPMSLSSENNPRGWPHGDTGCQAYHVLDLFQKTLVAITVVWISIDRLWFCYRPDVYAAHMSNLLAGCSLALIWILSIANTCVLNFKWIRPSLHSQILGGGGILAGGDSTIYNFTTCVGPRHRLEEVADISLYVVPSALSLVLVFVSFGAMCTKRRMFYEDRSPLVHTLIFTLIFSLLYTALTFVICYRYLGQTDQLIHAGRVIKMLKLINIGERVFYVGLPFVLLVLAYEVREGMKVLCRSCCCRSKPTRPI